MTTAGAAWVSRSSPRVQLSNPLRFGIVFTVVNLHILRNVAELPYLVLYAGVTLWTLNALVKRRPRFVAGPTAWWLALALAGGTVTLGISGGAAAFQGLSRFLFAVPVLLAFLAFTTGRQDLVRHIRTMTVVFTIGALTLPLQFVTGPISFFASDSERAGLVRYSSVLGSLTILGIALGCYLVLSWEMPKSLRPLVLGLQMSAGAASLSKAAVANGLIGLAVIVLSERRRAVTALLSIAALGIGFASFVSASPELAGRVSAVSTSFGLDTGIQTYDRNIGASITERLTTLPLANVAALEPLHSPMVYVVGGGYGMGSTALVAREASLAPMAHNQYVELFTVFGALGAAVAVAVLVTVGVRLYRLDARRHDPMLNRIFLTFCLWLVNAVFANGIAYQPVTASILWLAVFCAGAGPELFGHGDLSPQPTVRRTLRTPAKSRSSYARLQPESRR